MTNGRDTLSKSETVTIAAIEQGVPLLVEAREIIAAFHAMIRKKAHGELEPWLKRACASLVMSFANGVIKDKAAVSAANGWRSRCFANWNECRSVATIRLHHTICRVRAGRP